MAGRGLSFGSHRRRSTITQNGTATELLGIGLYSVPDASKILGIEPSTLRRWVEGYSFPLSRWSRSNRPPVFAPALPRSHGRLALTFLDLIQLRVVQGFRGVGVPLQRIRAAAEIAAKIFGTSHPFAYERFRTDGRDVFADVVERDQAWGLVNLTASGQKTFPEMVEASLRELGYHAETRLAQRWYLAGPGGGVVIDPTIAFGHPVVDEIFVPTRAISEQAAVDPEPEVLANWFRIDVRHVRDALRFEQQLARAA